MTTTVNSMTAAVAVAACGVTAWLVYAMLAPRKCPNEEPSDDPVKQGFSMRKVPKDLDVIVIGSGMGGLSTAAVLAKEGKRVLVLEQHDIAGGNLHTFTEKGYEFDTGLHYIGGKIGSTRGNSSAGKLLDYITDEQIQWEQMDDAYDIAIAEGERYHFYSGWTRLKKELKDSFPDEAVAIDRYFALAHDTAENAFPLYLVLKMMPRSAFRACSWMLGRYLGILKKTTKEVMESLTSNRKLIGVLTYHFGDYGEPPARGSFAMNAMIAGHYRSGSYYPVGGPLRISESIARTIERWGGKVLVRAPVSSILIDERNRAYGVVVKDKKILAKQVVSSVGFPATYTKLVPEDHQHLVATEIEMMSDPSIASNISLMSMFVGIDDPDGTLLLPKSNIWVHASWDHDKNMQECAHDHLKLPAFFISFSSAKDPSYSSRHPGKQCALVIGPCCYDDVEHFKGEWYVLVFSVCEAYPCSLILHNNFRSKTIASSAEAKNMLR